MGTDRYGEKNGSYLQPSVQIRTNPYKSVPKKPAHKLTAGQVGQVGQQGTHFPSGSTHYRSFAAGRDSIAEIVRIFARGCKAPFLPRLRNAIFYL